MAIQRSALDLRHPRFRQTFAGVDPAEVDNLLELAADSYEAVYADLDVLRQRHVEVSAQLKQVHEGERELSRVVIQAEEAAGRIRRAAEEEAGRIIAQAESQATALTTPLESARTAIEREIEATRMRRRRAAQALQDAIAGLERREPIDLPESTPLPEASVDPEEDTHTAATGSALPRIDPEPAAECRPAPASARQPEAPGLVPPPDRESEIQPAAARPSHLDVVPGPGPQIRPQTEPAAQVVASAPEAVRPAVSADYAAPGQPPSSIARALAPATRQPESALREERPAHPSLPIPAAPVVHVEAGQIAPAVAPHIQPAPTAASEPAAAAAPVYVLTLDASTEWREEEDGEVQSSGLGVQGSAGFYPGESSAEDWDEDAREAGTEEDAVEEDGLGEWDESGEFDPEDLEQELDDGEDSEDTEDPESQEAPVAAGSDRSAEERLRELLALHGGEEPERPQPAANRVAESPAPDDLPAYGPGFAQAEGRSFKPWLMAGAAAVLLFAFSAGLPRLFAVISGTAPAGSTSIAGERLEGAPVLAASAIPGGASADRPRATAPAPPPAEPDAPIRVRLIPSRECWVRITADGRAEERTLVPGETIVRGAQEYVAIRVGDAGALAVELNGATLPPLGFDGQVVNRVFRAEAR